MRHDPVPVSLAGVSNPVEFADGGLLKVLPVQAIN